ncbi:Uncharacterised protein [Mycobacteroides abscessus subsp. abscessus]|nr:Uncharacterised protein [Mycobacteroides abscessus subsp. abscessus]
MPHCVERVGSSRVPTQVAQIVVAAIPICVTSLLLWRTSADERLEYETVYASEPLPAVLREGNLKVAGLERVQT